MVLHGLLCGRVGRCRANDGVRAERFGPRSFFVARRRALEGSERLNAPCLPEAAERFAGRTRATHRPPRGFRRACGGLEGAAARGDRARYVGFMREVIRTAVGDDGSQQYVLERDGDCVGRLRYRGAPEAVLDILHVWVDPALRRGGLGQRLVDHAAQQVRAAGGRITATCGFARSVLARDPVQRDLVL